MNVIIRAMVRLFLFGERWNVLIIRLRLVDWNIHLSLHENIITIAIINIHCLYTNEDELYQI